jgi:hypothetical protein
MIFHQAAYYHVVQHFKYLYVVTLCLAHHFKHLYVVAVCLVHHYYAVLIHLLHNYIVSMCLVYHFILQFCDFEY